MRSGCGTESAENEGLKVWLKGEVWWSYVMQLFAMCTVTLRLWTVSYAWPALTAGAWWTLFIFSAAECIKEGSDPGELWGGGHGGTSPVEASEAVPVMCTTSGHGRCKGHIYCTVQSWLDTFQSDYQFCTLNAYVVVWWGKCAQWQCLLFVCSCLHVVCEKCFSGKRQC